MSEIDINPEAVEALASELDKLGDDQVATGFGDQWVPCDTAADTLRALVAQVDALRAALEPFSDAAGEMVEGTEDHDDAEKAIVTVGRCTLYLALTLGDFRLARAECERCASP